MAHDKVGTVLEEAELAIRRRGLPTGRPAGPEPQFDSAAGMAAAAARRWARGEPPSVAERPQLVGLIHAQVTAALASVHWERWLRLERALLDGSETGDVLFTASVLRTMIEEVGRLTALDVPADVLAGFVASNNERDQARLRRFLAAAWTSLLPAASEHDADKAVLKDVRKRIELSPRVKLAYGALNGFVHPNYGSHMAALYPEGRAAARVLLEGVAAVYEAFFALSASGDAPPPLPASDFLGAERNALLDALEPHLRLLPQALEGAPSEERIEVAEIHRRLAGSTSQETLQSIMTEEEFASSLNALPRWPHAEGRADIFRMWSGALADDVLALAAARRAEKEFTAACPGGPPDRSLVREWLDFHMRALELTVAASGVKLSMLRLQLVRQIVAQAPLGIWLAARPLIEQWALEIWLPQDVEAALDQVAQDVQGAEVPEAGERLAEALANYLTGLADAPDAEPRPWATDPGGGGALGRLDLAKVVEAGFRNDAFWRNQYSFACDAMHGRAARDIDFRTVEAETAAFASACGTLILARTLEEATIAPGATVLSFLRMRHASETRGAPDEPGTRWTFGMSEVLEPGKDYAGNGTREHPFILAPHVEFYAGTRAVIKMVFGSEASLIGRDSELITQLDQDEKGRWCDVWMDPARECWIRMRPDRGAGL